MTPAYCTNVHPAEDLTGVLAQLDRYSVPVRERLGVDDLPLGLWLAQPVAAALAADPTAVARFSAELRKRGLSVRTLNAFPYGGFHDEVVKQAVYRPDWTDPRRLQYTVDCAVVLAGLVPEGASGSISTLPLGWRDPWGPAEDASATEAFGVLAQELRKLENACGTRIAVAVEPEPGCVLDTMADAVGWLSGRVDPDHIGVCLDTCHLAVSFADPAKTVTSVLDAGLRVVKVQASAALEVPADALDLVKAYDEPRYLHQVREHGPTGVLAADDIDIAFTNLPGTNPWRVHFHMPLHHQPPTPARSTTDILLAALTAVKASGATPDIEVETYTWSVLPDTSDTALVEGIAAELRWLETAL